MTRTLGAASFRRVIPIGASSSRRVRGSKLVAPGTDPTVTADGAAGGSAASCKDMEPASLQCRAVDMRAPALTIRAYALCQGRGRSSELRALLHAVPASDLPQAA